MTQDWNGTSQVGTEASSLADVVTMIDEPSTGPSENSYDKTFNVFRGIFCAVGLVGNFLVIFVVLGLREYKKSLTHWYVLQLAIADSLFLVCMPFFMAEDINQKWIFPAWLCSACEAVLFINFYASVMFLLMMGMDRYIAVCHGFSDAWQKFRTKRAAVIITTSVWLVSILLSIAPGLNIGVFYCRCQYDFSNLLAPSTRCPEKSEDPEDYEQNLYHEECIKALNPYYHCEIRFPSDETGSINGTGFHCFTEDSRLFAFQIFNFVVMFLVPLAILIVCYTLIIIRIRKVQKRATQYQLDSSSGIPDHSTPTPVHISAASAKDRRNRIRVTVMCCVLVVSFIVCWLPYHVANMMKGAGFQAASRIQCENITKATSLVTFLASVLNPFIYNFFGTNFGKRLRSSFSSVRRRLSRRFSVARNLSPRHSRPSGETAVTGLNTERKSPMK